MAGGDLEDLVACVELGKSSCFPDSEPLGEPEEAGLGLHPDCNEVSVFPGRDCPGLEACTCLGTN